uniref:Craniofacial development protein 2 n=2 Tax=Cacopsylla melanoneura TaxID=428564 RepID=A0A8D8WNS4_9HEMI
MIELGKSHSIIQQMERLGVKILGISESHWKGSGKKLIQDTTFYYSGSPESDGVNYHGVAIAVDKTINNNVKHFLPLSNRVCLLQLNAQGRHINIIQAYAPTMDKDDEEVEEFYRDIAAAMRLTKSIDVTIVLGDFNAKVGEGSQTEVMGCFGLGERNERGDRLLLFCQENKMILTNTLYKQPKRRLYTWISPQDKPERIIRNQIDYIMINQRYRNTVKSAKTYPGAYIGSDHSILIADVQIKLKKLVQPKSRTQIDVRKLQDLSVKGTVFQELNENLDTISMQHDAGQVEENWLTIKSALLGPCNKHLKRTKAKREKDWMTEQILRLMEVRQELRDRNADKTKLKELNNKIRYECRQAKEQWLKEKCEEIEHLQTLHDAHNMHKKIRELTGSKKQTTHYLLNECGDIIVETDKQVKLWEKYIEQLFDDDRVNVEDIETPTGPEILKDEISYVINNMKKRKAAGPDEMPGDVLQLIEEKHLDKLAHLFNQVYTSGILPVDWLKSTFITLPKKQNAKKCEDHRTISLMSHVLKVLLKVIHKRINKKLEENISETQFGFRNGFGTREALFAYNVLAQRCLDVNKNVYVCFIDYNKAFDKVRHNRLINILKEENIDTRDIQIIKNLYFNQTAEISVNSEISKELKIKRGVRQGCVLSPLLFNVYSERIMAEALEEEVGGIVINGTHINNLRYADDTVLLAENMEDLQGMLNKVIRISEEYGLTLNTKKTKCMIVTKRNNPPEQLIAGGDIIEQVGAYTYLGTRVNSSAEYLPEIKIRIEKARAAFVNMRSLLSARDLGLETKTRLLKCYIFPILLYGVEAWTLNKECEKRLQAFEMWTYRRILRIPWTDRVTNVEVLRRMGKQVEILEEVKKRKLTYLGHIMRGPKYKILHLIIQGKIVGKRSVGRRRISWLRNLRDWFSCSSQDLFKAAINKVRLTLMVANLRHGDGT